MIDDDTMTFDEAIKILANGEDNWEIEASAINALYTHLRSKVQERDYLMHWLEHRQYTGDETQEQMIAEYDQWSTQVILEYRRKRWQQFVDNPHKPSNKHLFLLDLDGTLIQSYMDRPDRAFDPVDWIEGADWALRDARQRGVRLAIVTNQGGVAYGLVSPAQIADKLSRVAQHLGYTGVAIYDGSKAPELRENVLPCLVSYDKSSDRHKPSPAMLIEAVRLHNADMGYVTMFGDRDEDQYAAIAAGVRFCWANEL